MAFAFVSINIDALFTQGSHTFSDIKFENLSWSLPMSKYEDKEQLLTVHTECNPMHKVLHILYRMSDILKFISSSYFSKCHTSAYFKWQVHSWTIALSFSRTIQGLEIKEKIQERQEPYLHHWHTIYKRCLLYIPRFLRKSQTHHCQLIWCNCSFYTKEQKLPHTSLCVTQIKLLYKWHKFHFKAQGLINQIINLHAIHDINTNRHQRNINEVEPSHGKQIIHILCLTNWPTMYCHNITHSYIPTCRSLMV